MRILGGALFFGVLFSHVAMARGVDIDFAGHFGYIQSKHTAYGTAVSNDLLGYGAVVSGVKMLTKHLAVGGRTEYRWIEQFSDPTVAKGGNRRGTRLVPFSPMIEINLKRWRFRFDYQFMGSYELTYAGNAGKKISFTKPRGQRLEADFCMVRGRGRFYNIPGVCILYGGGFLERVKFLTEEQDGAIVTPSSTLVLDQLGVVLGVGF